MTPTQIISALLAVASVVGGVVANQVEHPISDYLENASEVEEETLPDVCGTLGEIVELAYDYAEEKSNYAPSDLSNAEDASLVVHRALVEASSESQIRSLYDELDEFAGPARTYSRTRNAQSDSFLLFIATFALSVIVLLLDLGRASGVGGTLLDGLIAAGAIAAVLLFGVALYRSYQWARYRQELDDIVEDNEFIMDADRTNTSRRIEVLVITIGVVFSLGLLTTFVLFALSL